MPPHSSRGRQANRGPEGLAITPDGSRAYAIQQSPLLQDGGVDAANKRVGTNLRIAEFMWTAEGSFRPGRELVYQLDSAANGVNEITPVGNDTFLVLEKDGASGAKAKQRTIYRIDLAGATDVSGVESLPQTGLPKGFVPVRRPSSLTCWTLPLDWLAPPCLPRWRDWRLVPRSQMAGARSSWPATTTTAQLSPHTCGHSLWIQQCCLALCRRAPRLPPLASQRDSGQRLRWRRRPRLR